MPQSTCGTRRATSSSGDNRRRRKLGSPVMVTTTLRLWSRLPVEGNEADAAVAESRPLVDGEEAVVGKRLPQQTWTHDRWCASCTLTLFSASRIHLQVVYVVALSSLLSLLPTVLRPRFTAFHVPVHYGIL